MFYHNSYVLCFFLIIQFFAMRFNKIDLSTVISKLLTGDVWQMFYDMKAITKIILSGLAGYFGNLVTILVAMSGMLQGDQMFQDVSLSNKRIRCKIS